MTRLVTAGAAAAIALLVAPAAAQEELPGSPRQPSEETVTLTPAELFRFADAARDRGDYAAAEASYRALATHPGPQVRTEARFRLALMLADRLQKYREAALMLRAILDQNPDAARVRIELARMHAMLGNASEAARELRAAQAAGLPPEAEKLVRFYSAAFNNPNRAGANLQVALAPDTNINRATHSDTLGTVLGEFQLSPDAQARSGVGLAAQAQAWRRLSVDPTTDLLLRVSGNGSLYRRRAFDDYSLALEAGPQISSGQDRISFAGLASWRWYGQKPYTFSWGGTGTLQHVLSRTDELRLEATIVRIDDRINDLRDATSYGVAVGIDHAFSGRFGGGSRVTARRQVAGNPSYSLASFGVTNFLFREFGQTTAVVTFGYNHLEADERLALYARRRVDDRVNFGLSATFRALQASGFAPLLRFGYERNHSTIEIYDYDRLFAEFGVTGAF